MSGYYYLNNRVAREYRHNCRKAKKQNQMKKKIVRRKKNQQIVRNMKNSKKAFFKHMGCKEEKNKVKSLLFSLQQKGKFNQVDA